MKTGMKIVMEELEALKASGVYSEERVLTVPQGSRIDTTERKGETDTENRPSDGDCSTPQHTSAKH